MNLIDIVGYRPYITSFGHERYKSTFGKITGMITILVIIALALYFTIEVLLGTEITVIYNETSSIVKPINISTSPIIIYLADGVGDAIEEKYQEIRANYWNWSNHNPNSSVMSYAVPEIILEPCDLDKHFGEFRELFAKYDLRNKKCFPRGQWDYSLTGKYGDPADQFSFINIVVNMCNNLTQNNTCPLEELIEPILKNTYLNFYYVDYEVDHTCFSTPVKPVIRAESLPINWDLHTRYLYQFKHILHTTDQGFIFEDFVHVNGYTFANLAQGVQIRHGSVLYPNITIGTLTLNRYPKSDAFTRQYVKGQSVIARIGGVIQAMLLAGQAITYIITKNLFTYDIINLLQIDFQEKLQMLNDINPSQPGDIASFNNIQPQNIQTAGTRHKKYKYSFIDIVCPPSFKKKNRKLLLTQELMKTIISYENFIKIHFDFATLLNVIFDDDQLSVFQKIPRRVGQFLQKTENTIKKEDDPLFHSTVQDHFTKKLNHVYNNSLSV